jgi:hypothetical protein
MRVGKGNLVPRVLFVLAASWREPWQMLQSIMWSFVFSRGGGGVINYEEQPGCRRLFCSFIEIAHSIDRYRIIYGTESVAKPARKFGRYVNLVAM